MHLILFYDIGHLLVGEGRTRRYKGLIPKISPLAIITLALAQTKINRMAKQLPLESLKDKARDIRLGSVNPEDLHRRQHALRSVRKWTDEEGMCCGRWRTSSICIS